MAQTTVVAPVALNASKQCTVTPPWFVQGSEYKPLNAAFELLVNGEEAFGAVYHAIEAAKKSVCIICWGFQPSMYFIRGNDNNSLRIGELLEKKALAGVKVRVVCFVVDPLHLPVDPAGKAIGEPNTPGRRLIALKDNPEQRTATYDYDQNWYTRYDADQRVLDGVGKSLQNGELLRPRTANLRFVGRGFTAGERKKVADQTYEDQGLGIVTKGALAAGPSHHQKMVLVDYEDPALHVGFVMGHNMLDAYWDSSAHGHRRMPAELGRFGRNGAMPFEDFSARVRGPIVGDLFGNFAQAWKKETGETLSRPEFKNYPSKLAYTEADQKAAAGQGEHVSIADYASLNGITGQIVRTQMQRDVQDIKKLYLQAVNNATQYIYIENQYFRWPPLAKKIKQSIAAQIECGRAPETHGPLYLFVITNANEAGMGSGVVNTYRMLEQLGRPDVLPEVSRLEKADDARTRLASNTLEITRLEQANANLAIAPHTPAIRAQRDANQQQIDALRARQKPLQDEMKHWQNKNAPILSRDLEEDGLKVHICTLVAPDTPAGKPWQDVYIHAKLMLIDDTFMTLGSANINTRSMEVDSELNIAHDRHEITQPTRRKLWAMHTRNHWTGDTPSGGEAFGQAGMKQAYKNWEGVIKKNKDARAKSQAPTASLVEFYSGTTERKNTD